MPSLVLDQATVFKEFTDNIPVDIYGSLRSHVCGGHAALHRYKAPAEKPTIALGAYNSVQNQAYAWPGLVSPTSVIDLSYFQLFIDNAYLQYYQDLIGSGDTIAPVTNFPNRIRALATNWVANGTSYPRAAGLFDRDVRIGDWIYLSGGGDTLWTSVASILPDSLSGTVGSASGDPGNYGSQSASTTSSQTGGSSNYISLSSITGTYYDGSPTGDLSETYTLVVTTASTGGDATLARFSVASASGRDNVASVQPAAFGTAFAVGTRGLRITFTNTNTGNPLTGGATPIDFIVGQTWQVTVLQAWTPPNATSGGSYIGTANQKYIVTVTRGGLYQVQLPITAPTATPTVSPTGGGPTGGNLQAGTYYVKYTYVNAIGETTPSPESTQFTVATGNVPQVTLPALPTGVTSINLYLTPTNGASGTEVLYATSITTTTYNLSAAVTQQPPTSNNAIGVESAPTVVPTVNPTGGGATGGALQAGVFYLKYTYVNANGETAPSPESAAFTVASTNQPQVTLPALPAGVTSISLYITPPGGASGGECIRYATGITTTTYTMATASIKLPPTTNTTSPSVTNPAFTPTVSASGGGSSGGKLPAGVYYLKVTYTGTSGETLPGPESASFTVVAGGVPQITNVPTAAPTNATGFNVYLTPVGSASGSEVLYSTANAFPGGGTYNLSTAFPTTAGSPPGSNTTNPAVSNPATTPTVNVTGGGASGGLLPPGAYYVKYTYSGKGGETQASSESTLFTVAAGNIPQVTLPSLPTNVTAINLYLTPTGGASGSEILYAQGITTVTYNLALPLPVQTPPPGPNTAATFSLSNPSIAPTVNATGGGTTGGNLTAGSYRLDYTWVGGVSGETLSSVEAAFTIGAGNIPQVTIPSLPNGVSGANIYLTQPGGAAGSETKFPSAVNQAGPTINLNASSTSGLVGRPPTTTTATALGANPSPPQVTVTTSSGLDSSGPTNVTAATTNVSIGTEGVLMQWSGNGLRKSDLYTLQATEVAQGPFRTLVLTNNMSAAMQGASDLSVTLYIKENMTVPQQRLSSPPNLNWTVTQAAITVNSGLTAYNPTLTNGGVPFSVPVVSGLDTVMYANYREWLMTYAQVLTPVSVPVSSDPLTVATTALGTVDPDNPLAYGVYKALLNCNGTLLYFSASGDPTVEANWAGCLAILAGLKNIRHLVPLTANQAVLTAYQQHIDTQSDDNVGGEWRFGLFNLKAQTSIPVVFGPPTSTTLNLTPTTSDGNAANATIANNPLLTGTNYTYVACTTRNGKFVTNGVQPGDVMRFLFTQDAFGNPSWTSFTVLSVVNEDTLTLAAGPNAAVSTAQRFEIWRNLTSNQVADNLADTIEATNDRRIAYVWPDFMLDGGQQVDGVFLCAAIGGFLSGIAPHQGIRYVAIGGFDGSVPRSQQFFTNAQLQILKTAGAIVVTADEFSNVYSMCALTTSQSGVIDDESEQAVRTNDALKYSFYNATQQFFGKANITPTAMSMINAQVQGAIQTAKQQTNINRIGPLLTDGSINTLRPHATIRDRIVLIVNVTYSYAVDDATVSVIIGT
jgi:hypothetical protein